MFSLTTLLFTHYYSNRGWVHKWLFSGEHRRPSKLQLRTPPQTRRTEGQGNEQIKAMIDNTTGAVSSWFLPPINKFNQCHLNWADIDATGFLAYDYFSFMKKHWIYIRDTCMSHALFIISLSHSMCVCFSSLIKAGFSRRGKPFASEFKQAYWNEGWGNLWSRRQPNLKGRGHTTHQPACGPMLLKGVNLSEIVSVCLLVTFAVAELHSSIWIVNPLPFYASILSLCVCFISVSGSSGEQQPLHWDCRSLSLYIYSYYSCCER